MHMEQLAKEIRIPYKAVITSTSETHKIGVRVRAIAINEKR